MGDPQGGYGGNSWSMVKWRSSAWDQFTSDLLICVHCMDIIEVAALGIYHTYYWISVLPPSHCVTLWSLIARNTLYIVWRHGFEHPVIPCYTLDKWNVYIIEIIFVWTCHSCWFGHSWDAICRDTLQVELHRPHNCLSVSQAPGFGPKGVEPRNCGSHLLGYGCMG